VWTHEHGDGNSISTFTNPAYFTESGFTGTKRDQFEFWAGVSAGYASPKGQSGGGWGIATPQIGFEYYYNVITPTAAAGSPDYVTFWTSPTFSVNFPNGKTKSTGFGAGANQYSFGFNVNNYLQVGKFAVTVNPAEFFYATRNENQTQLINGEMQNLKGGLSITLMDVAAGYQVTDSLFVGIHHSYSLYNVRGSDFPESREGKIGPSVAYYGLAKYGLYIWANLNFDYYTSPNLKRGTQVTMAVVKTF
jgi:hypothetical protein